MPSASLTVSSTQRWSPWRSHKQAVSKHSSIPVFSGQVVQSADLAFDLNYTIFDFGGHSGRIDQVRRGYLQLTLNSMTRIGE